MAKQRASRLLAYLSRYSHRLSLILCQTSITQYNPVQCSAHHSTVCATARSTGPSSTLVHRDHQLPTVTATAPPVTGLGLHHAALPNKHLPVHSLLPTLPYHTTTSPSSLPLPSSPSLTPRLPLHTPPWRTTLTPTARWPRPTRFQTSLRLSTVLISFPALPTLTDPPPSMLLAIGPCLPPPT